MNRKFWTTLAGLCALVTFGLAAQPAAAQSTEVKAKPPMFTWVADWQVAHAHWGDMDAAAAPSSGALQKALEDGTIIGYGRDTNLVHQPDRETHDVWWSAMSMAGLLKALDRVHAANDPNSATLNDAKHWDEVVVSRYYNWKSGPYKNAYSHIGIYQLKADAPDDGLDNLSQHLIVPVLEKLIANGTLLEYEIDEPAIHTSAPGQFFIVYVTPTPEGLDTVQAAVMGMVKDHPLGFQAFGSEVEDAGHRDELAKSEGVYK